METLLFTTFPHDNNNKSLFFKFDSILFFSQSVAALLHALRRKVWSNFALDYQCKAFLGWFNSSAYCLEYFWLEILTCNLRFSAAFRFFTFIVVVRPKWRPFLMTEGRKEGDNLWILGMSLWAGCCTKLGKHPKISETSSKNLSLIWKDYSWSRSTFLCL